MQGPRARARYTPRAAAACSYKCCVVSVAAVARIVRRMRAQVRFAVVAMLAMPLASSKRSPPTRPWGAPFSVFQDLGPNEPTKMPELIFTRLGPSFGIKNMAGGSRWGLQTNGMGVPWPQLSATGVGELPQTANLTEALAQMAAWINMTVPPDFDGIACIDQETFTNIWELHCPPQTVSNGGWDSNYGGQYCEASRALVRQRHPDWQPATIEAVAKVEYESAATAWLVAVLELSKSMRPAAKWGYWMFPVAPFNHGADNRDYNTSNCHVVESEWRCVYDDPVLGERLRSYTDRQLPIWAASTGIFPSLYLEPFCATNASSVTVADCASRNAAFIKGVVSEAKRAAILGARSRGPDAAPAPVIPFVWQYYLGAPPGSNTSTHISVAELESSFRLPYELGADGVVLWFDAESDHPDARFPPQGNYPGNTTEYYIQHTGPLVRHLLAEAGQCSQKNCSNHGRCCMSCGMGQTCECYPGWRGKTCAVAV